MDSFGPVTDNAETPGDVECGAVVAVTPPGRDREHREHRDRYHGAGRDRAVRLVRDLSGVRADLVVILLANSGSALRRGQEAESQAGADLVGRVVFKGAGGRYRWL